MTTPDSACLHGFGGSRGGKPIDAAVNAAAREAFDQLVETWGQRYPAMVRLWDNAWEESTP